MRWKYEKNNKFASNAKLVEWSDGSYGVQIGNEIFDLALGEVNDTKVFSVYRVGYSFYFRLFELFCVF